MSDTITNPIAELEAQFNLEVPCGGNNFPAAHPCPHDAPAVMVQIHYHSCGGSPKGLKCGHCYAEWLNAALDATCLWGLGQCNVCGVQLPIEEWYREL
ncbi:hypothetical protein [Mycobacterium phage WXIN]|nr:hypothetical protein [Mycobacterium phage WXIN]